MAADLYAVLGVPEDASTETIKSVYRQLARTLHPDVNADETAVEHIRQITEAFVSATDRRSRAPLASLTV
jgi:DnaJ-class molecular chaperone